ncbi:MAG TPA: divergent polysaccharide deacetylase family protein, partial [Xanthobacteraceae bacterium]|nr:divergent polysaccharide deacetylase family protein [Xanthobacteraceae bacterium]
MTADDLNAPLGQQLRKRRLSVPITTSQVMAAVLTLFLGVFVVWAVVGSNPFGGEPIAVVPINLHPGPAAKTDGQGPPKVVAVNP